MYLNFHDRSTHTYLHRICAGANVNIVKISPLGDYTFSRIPVMKEMNIYTLVLVICKRAASISCPDVRRNKHYKMFFTNVHL
jgi:hypothetical protein